MVHYGVLWHGKPSTSVRSTHRMPAGTFPEFPAPRFTSQSVRQSILLVLKRHMVRLSTEVPQAWDQFFWGLNAGCCDGCLLFGNLCTQGPLGEKSSPYRSQACSRGVLVSLSTSTQSTTSIGPQNPNPQDFVGGPHTLREGKEAVSESLQTPRTCEPRGSCPLPNSYLRVHLLKAWSQDTCAT